MRALVIEDNSDIAECIIESLSQMGITCDWFSEGHYFEASIAVATFDIIILDINLPDTDGFTILKKYRLSESQTPVLIISARISVEDRVHGLNIGADDYLVKPFALNEFEARVRALLRRDTKTKSETITFGDISYNQTTREFSIYDKVLTPPPRERAVLEILIKKQGDVISKEHIAQTIFNFDDLADISAIEIYIHRLRKKLKDSMVTIATHRGLGYALELNENP